MDSDEPEKLLRSQLDYCDEWLSRYREAQDVAVWVLKIRDATEWGIEALSNRPAEADAIIKPELASIIQDGNRYLMDALPMIPRYDVNLIASGSTVTMSGTAYLYSFVAEVGELGTPEAQEYSEKYGGLYRVLQGKQHRADEARDLVSKLGNPQTLRRFDDASRAYLLYKGGTKERTEAASDMRNLLYGIEGDLWRMAPKTSGEKMTWGKIAERLAKNGPHGTEYEVVKRQEPIFSSLIDSLSTIAKDREGKSLANLDNIWGQVLDHICVVLGLLNLP